MLMPALSLWAQPLPVLIDSAAHHLPVLLQKEALVKAAEAGVTDARHSFLPNSTIGDELSVGSDNALPGSYYSFGLIPSVSSGINPANNTQAAGGNIAFLFNEYELVNFGLKKATIRRAETNTTVSRADLDREVYLLKWQIGKLFLQMRKSQYQLSIDSENITRYSRLYTVIRAVTRSGIKPGADSALAMAELSQSRTVYNQTQGQFRQLLQQLSYLTGITADRLQIDTVNTGSNFNGQLPAVPVDSSQPANPLLDYYTKQRQLYEQTEQLVKKSYLPKILLTGITWARGSGIDYQDNYKSIPAGWGYQRYNYLAGLTFQYNLFNLVHRRDKEAIIHQEMTASDYEQKQQQLSLQNLGSRAGEGIRTALKNLAEIPVQIRSAQDAFNQKTAQYRAGIINLVDLTNATFVLYRSESAYVQAISDWLLASLDRAAANGGIDTFIQSLK
jgi:outer membrane protein TolC